MNCLRLSVLMMVFLYACDGNNSTNHKQGSRNIDPHSYANSDKAIIKHLDFNLKVDFDKKILTGFATWTIDNIAKTDEIIFDTKGLYISKILVDNSKEEVLFSLGDEDEFLGQALSVQIKPETKKVTIYYSTGADAAALQWLNPEQTSGKEFPFLFTQSQAILARTWIPIQDSPGVRFTYSANIEVPKHLLALMSAVNPQEKNKDGRYHFEMKHAIPSYLMALAVGDIEFKKVNDITGVYAEPNMLAKAAYEFDDMGKMLTATEELFGKYRWDRFDVLVLPSSFPFGGMENPMLTFATPTIITGDRSLVSLIAHELAHSWSGNLVTNATWNDFWINEGFTVYIERRIIEKLYGKDEAEMLEVLGYKELIHTVDDMGAKNPDTRLKADFTDRDPDESVTDIPYEKGYFFLKSIENIIGREKFDEFLKNYFHKYAFKGINIKQFQKELDHHIIKGDNHLKSLINSYSWIYQPGIPKELVVPESKVFKAIDSMIYDFTVNNNLNEVKTKLKSTNQNLYFIKTLPQDLGKEKMRLIDEEFNFTNSENADIQCAWYTLAIKNSYDVVYPNMASFLINVGRRKFLIPIYKQLILTTKGKILAKEIYFKARDNYHSVTYRTVDDILTSN
jgi:leukotriene-A4 hydrolase